MGRALAVALLVFCFGNLAAAQVPVPEAAKVVVEKYEAEASRISREHTALIAELKQKHAAQLDQLIAKAKDAGDLDGVLKLGEEKKKVARSEGPVGGTAPTAAASARRSYDEALKKGETDFKKTARAKLDDFLKELSEVEKAETKADRIASAKEVRAYRLDREKSGTSKPVIRENPLPDAPTGEWVDLLEWSEGVDWAPRGIDWNANVEGKPTKAGIRLKGASGVALPLPVIVDGDFDLDVEFTRNSGDDMSIVFPVGMHTMALVLAGNRFDLVGKIDGHWTDGNPTMKSPGRTVNGKRHRVKINVHDDRDQA